MTAPFVTNLRTNGELIQLGSGGEPALHLRVQVAELWDSVRLDAPPSESVISAKRAALDALYPVGIDPDEYVVRLHGFEILDEDAPLSSTAAKNGSTFLITDRRRRPVE